MRFNYIWSFLGELINPVVQGVIVIQDDGAQLVGAEVWQSFIDDDDEATLNL